MKEEITDIGILKVLKPVAIKDTNRVQPSNRPTSLDNKIVGLVWNGKSGGDVALGRVAETIKKYFLEAKFKEFFYGFPFTKSQIEQIVAGCDVVVGSTGD